jgi:nucleoside-diphosphate-sugar epimerase
VKRVLFLGASGLIGPWLTPGLRDHYDLRLADVKPHPDGVPVATVDVRDYGQVLEAARGCDAIMNFTVVRGDPDDSFHVNTAGAWHVMRAAVELGIDRVIHSGPQGVRSAYDHHFGIDDAPQAPGVGLYGISKWLSAEICRVFAEKHGITTAYFVFNGLGPAPEAPLETPQDTPTFVVVWEDLQHACRLALEVESLPGNFQLFNLLSYRGPGKYNTDKAQRLLGFEPTRDWDAAFRWAAPGPGTATGRRA